MAKHTDRIGVDPNEGQAATAADIDRSVKRDEGTRDERRSTIAADQERQFTEDDRLQMFLETFANSSLPQLPPIPGYHQCWLSTTNTKDTIHARLRIGYELVRPDEVPGDQNLKLANGEYAGCVGINEMVLAKLPDNLFQRYMKHLHHDKPMEEASKLRYRAEALKDEAQGYGADLEIGDGIQQVDRQVRTPRQMFE